MVISERMIAYIRSLEYENNDLLKKIEDESKRDNVPVIRKEMESFIRVILNIVKPEKILELGTATGYSAILMSEAVDSIEEILTVENYPERLEIARKNIAKAPEGSKIQLIESDALEILKNMPHESIDFIFMDFAKAQYINALPYAVLVLKKGGVLLSDNVLLDGDVIESRFAVDRRDRTIHKRMREYIEAVKNHPELITSIVPIGDGVTISVKGSRHE